MGVTDAFLVSFAEALLPFMDDPGAFESPMPACNAEAHDWSIVKNKVVEWRHVHGSTTYRVAIVCANCDHVAGLG